MTDAIEPRAAGDEELLAALTITWRAIREHVVTSTAPIIWSCGPRPLQSSDEISISVGSRHFSVSVTDAGLITGE